MLTVVLIIRDFCVQYNSMQFVFKPLPRYEEGSTMVQRAQNICTIYHRV